MLSQAVSLLAILATMSSQYFLCLDQGGTHSRALVIDHQATIITEARVQVKHQRLSGGRVEQCPTELIDSLRRCALEAVSALDKTPRQTLMAGLVCQRSSLIAWRSDTGQAITPVLSWQDTRGQAYVPQSPDHLAQIQAQTGLRANAHFGASKMQALLQTDKDVQAAARNGVLRLSPLASFLAYHLLCERPYVVDRANAQRTLLMNMASRQWDETLLQHFGIEQSWLPDIQCSNELRTWGHLPLASASIPLQVLSGDQSAAVFAHGALEPDTVYINLGTGGFLLTQAQGISAAELMPLLLSLSASSCGGDEESLIEATINGAGAALDWLQQHDEVVMTPALIEEALHYGEQDNIQEAVFINTVGGLGSPDWRSQIEPVFIGAETIQARLLSVLESIIFLIQRNLDEITRHKPSINRLLLSGGLSKSPALCQRLANLSGLAVERSEQSEATALGLAYCCVGKPNNRDWPALKTTAIKPEDDRRLQDRYQHWHVCMNQMLLR